MTTTVSVPPCLPNTLGFQHVSTAVPSDDGRGDQLDQEFDAVANEIAEHVATLTERNAAAFVATLRKLVNNVHFSSDRSDYRTPPEVFAALDGEFDFTLDPAADATNHLCDRYFTQADDGLLQCWRSSDDTPARAFVNPPYGGELRKWVKKAFEEARDCGVLSVLLIPYRPGTKAWKTYTVQASEIRCAADRVRFVLPDGTVERAGAPFPSAIVVFDPRSPRFATGNPATDWEWTWNS